MVDLDKVTQDLSRWLIGRENAGTRIDNMQLLSGGFSQFMAAFDLHAPTGIRKLVLRASRPCGEAITFTDRAAEWALISSLTCRGDVPLPAGLWFDEGDALGLPCFVVEHVSGPTVKKMMIDAHANDRRSFADRLCDCLVSIHAVPAQDLPADLPRPRDWDSHIDGLIDRWIALERSGLEPDPIVRYIAKWLRTNKPKSAPLCLVHGELNNDNLIVTDDGSLTAVDWEYGHIGDPREDIGWYRTVSTSVPPDLLADDTEAFCARYRAASGLSEEVINPAAVAYFGLLASVGVYNTLVGGPATVEASPDAPVLAAYVSAVLATTHLRWFESLSALECAASSGHSRR
ncbi:putative aminoglycoside phosphotransferase [Pseudomonas sp. GM21]|uniref:phosphotransferase family protein n=1 Tax=Pseudomonas sp. GM21 TaxID=1144325 RepID=UPI00027258EC|nr:phosphotransferase family protein [Pseudomonas sp. GM21]EJM24345.1 putative aminoglycoside phosphotransferase [Pseudomonas sp. GM21]